MNFSDAQVHKSGNQLHVTHGDDAELHVEFRMEAVHQGHKSAVEGRPIYEDAPFIRIMFPGDRTKTVDRPVNDTDKQRFPRQWEAFQKQEEQVASGTPITEWPPVSKSQALELKALNIHTVEQLAAISDSACDSFLGARGLREKANAWLSKAKDNAFISEMQERMARLEADNTALRDQLKQLGSKGKDKAA